MEKDKNSIIYPAVRKLDSVFTTDRIIVDGIPDKAYSNSPKSLIVNRKDGLSDTDYTGAASASGTVQSVWDGRTLYIFVDVSDGTPAYNTSYAGKNKAEAVGDGDVYDWERLKNGNQAEWHTPGTYTLGDAVEFSVDFWNDKVKKFQDDDGLFSITRDGYLTYYFDGMVNNHSSAYAQTSNREYNNRIGAWAAREKDDGSGYCVELALELYAWDWDYDEKGYLKAHECPIKNGNTYGIDIMIGDAPADETAREVRIYWSHSDNSLPFSSKDYNADWGEITLTGWKGEAFAFNDWNLINAIRCVESVSFKKGVWSAETQRELDGALSNAKLVAGSPSQVAVDTAVVRLICAVNGLRWADAKYPDPLDLMACFTLPDIFKFFDGSRVNSKADWERRRKEILDLAQFYEYGYKPKPPDRLEIESVAFTSEDAFSFVSWKNETQSYYKITVKVTYGDISASAFFKLRLPDKIEEDARPLPVILSFDAAVEEYLARGFAVLNISSSDITDDRNKPWEYRNGFMRSFFPYDRSSANEISNEMAAAWECSIAIDTLEKLAADKLEIGEQGTADKLLAPAKLAVTGFSICGKYAFVSAVFDERIGVCIPSAGGCTAASLYRYVINYKYGLTWSWGISEGSEVMGDTIRHNPGRTIELFRRFLTPGRFYKMFNGAFGYGERLPYDHEELVATLAPRAIILQSTIDDYADQSVGDALSLTLAKKIYDRLGYDGDMLVMQNFRDGTHHGDSYHGEDSPQRIRTAEYLNWYFRGTKITDTTLKQLQTDPFYNDFINGEDGYTRNFGGLKEIAPWLIDKI